MPQHTQLAMLSRKPVLPPRERVLTVTGSRAIRESQARNLLETYASPWLGRSITWLVGGAHGLDQWCMAWLIEHRETCIAVVPFSVAEQPTEVQPLLQRVHHVIALELPRSRASFARRNQYMVDASAVTLGFWVDKGGTYRTLQYALRTGREVHAIHVAPEA